MASRANEDLKILIVGLIVRPGIPLPSYFRELFETPKQLQAAIIKDNERIREAGYDITSYQINDADVAAGLEWIESRLRSKHFDGIMVGSGLRLVPTQTTLFENVVDVCRRAKPGAVLMFDGGPGTNWDTLQRNLGRLWALK